MAKPAARSERATSAERRAPKALPPGGERGKDYLHTMGRILVGTSGFVYGHWRGLFYPSDLPQRLWFARYTSEFETVELNNTFYRLPRADAVDRWRRESP